jgi:hypothetical protein
VTLLRTRRRNSSGKPVRDSPPTGPAAPAGGSRNGEPNSSPRPAPVSAARYAQVAWFAHGGSEAALVGAEPPADIDETTPAAAGAMPSPGPSSSRSRRPDRAVAHLPPEQEQT